MVAKSASPLVIGLGDGETMCGSDTPALLGHTRRMITELENYASSLADRIELEAK